LKELIIINIDIDDKEEDEVECEDGINYDTDDNYDILVGVKTLFNLHHCRPHGSSSS